MSGKRSFLLINITDSPVFGCFSGDVVSAFVALPVLDVLLKLLPLLLSSLEVLGVSLKMMFPFALPFQFSDVLPKMRHVVLRRMAYKNCPKWVSSIL